MPNNNEIQTNYLVATDPSVKTAIGSPLSFDKKDIALTENQEHAIESGIKKILREFLGVLTTVKKEEPISNFTDAEKVLCMVIADRLQETGGNIDYKVAVELIRHPRTPILIPLIEKLHGLIANWAEGGINIDLSEYAILILDNKIVKRK